MSMSCPDIVYGPQCCPNLIKSHCSHPRALKLLLVKSAANISKCSDYLSADERTIHWKPGALSFRQWCKSYTDQNSNNNNTFLFYNIAKVAEIRLKIQKYIYTVYCSSSLSNFTSTQYKTSPGWAPSKCEHGHFETNQFRYTFISNTKTGEKSRMIADRRLLESPRMNEQP